tara:strand:+ start:640 stop:840 length:201 start_codon:yes stop_codon:yes gene_type:complete
MNQESLTTAFSGEYKTSTTPRKPQRKATTRKRVAINKAKLSNAEIDDVFTGLFNALSLEELKQFQG